MPTITEEQYEVFMAASNFGRRTNRERNSDKDVVISKMLFGALEVLHIERYFDMMPPIVGY